jgi:hypothetical protein
MAGGCGIGRAGMQCRALVAGDKGADQIVVREQGHGDDRDDVQRDKAERILS